MSTEAIYFALGAGLGFAFMFLISFVLHHFIALAARPTARAVWTVGLAYTLGAALLMFGLGDVFSKPPAPEYASFIVLAGTVPAGMLIFLYWRYMFRRAWVENPIEGQSLANDDWTIGLWLLIVPVLAALPKAVSLVFATH